MIDEVLQEPLGGAHRNPHAMAETIKNALLQALTELQSLPLEILLERRQSRLLAYGEFKDG